MSTGNQHVVPHGDRWAVQGAGNGEVTKVTDTQAEAIKAGRKIAKQQKTELFIHGRDGRIRERDSYGSDPFPPRG